MCFCDYFQHLFNVVDRGGLSYYPLLRHFLNDIDNDPAFSKQTTLCMGERRGWMSLAGCLGSIDDFYSLTCAFFVFSDPIDKGNHNFVDIFSRKQQLYGQKWLV